MARRGAGPGRPRPLLDGPGVLRLSRLQRAGTPEGYPGPATGPGRIAEHGHPGPRGAGPTCRAIGGRRPQPGRSLSPDRGPRAVDRPDRSGAPAVRTWARVLRAAGRGRF